MATVAEVGFVRLGRQRSPSKQTGRYSTKYIRAANITSQGLDLQDVLEMDFTPDERREYVLLRDDILLAEASGSATQVGRAAIWQDEIEECCFQNTVIRFRSRTAIPRYSLLIFRYYSLSGTFGQTARGTGILHLGGSRFGSLPFPLPPLEEQFRIAKEVDRRTSELRAARESLESALARIGEQNTAILAAAASGSLVDQEAVIATREGRQFEDARALIDRTASPQQALDLLDTATQHQLEELGPLPTGWAWCRVDEAGEVTIGRQRSPEHQQGANMRPYLRVANVYEDRIDTSDVLQMNFTPEEFDVYELRRGDILLNEGQSPDLVGRPAMYRGEVPGACFQNTLLRFRAWPSVDPEYALIVFRHYLHAGIFKSAARWTTNIAHLSLRRFSALQFPLPPLREQERIAAEAKRRLEDSAQQEAGVRSSLHRLPALETELLSSAARGLLVPQDPEAEPASLLLASRSTQAENPRSAPASRTDGQDQEVEDKNRVTTTCTCRQDSVTFPG